ncbi:hypothetical protein OS965_40565 [Streptomyces sp. H27-G5]|nr:hypothetical protein [Streptomyces sp. H27-G5]MCY0924318.1 hypothetical protein [Streptomyces sp. H27-G5]
MSPAGHDVARDGLLVAAVAPVHGECFLGGSVADGEFGVGPVAVVFGGQAEAGDDGVGDVGGAVRADETVELGADRGIGEVEGLVVLVGELACDDDQVGVLLVGFDQVQFPAVDVAGLGEECLGGAAAGVDPGRQVDGGPAAQIGPAWFDPCAADMREPWQESGRCPPRIEERREVVEGLRDRPQGGVDGRGESLNDHVVVIDRRKQLTRRGRGAADSWNRRHQGGPFCDHPVAVAGWRPERRGKTRIHDGADSSPGELKAAQARAATRRGTPPMESFLDPGGTGSRAYPGISRRERKAAPTEMIISVAPLQEHAVNRTPTAGTYRRRAMMVWSSRFTGDRTTPHTLPPTTPTRQTHQTSPSGT